jgi:hypothetical protein
MFVTVLTEKSIDRKRIYRRLPLRAVGKESVTSAKKTKRLRYKDQQLVILVREKSLFILRIVRNT